MARKPEAGMPIIQKTGKKRYVFLQFQFPGPLHFQKSDEMGEMQETQPPAVQSTVSHSISKPGLYKSQRNNVSDFQRAMFRRLQRSRS